MIFITATGAGLPGVTGTIMVWRDRGTYYIGRPEKATRITYRSLVENYRQPNGSPIDVEKVSEGWPPVMPRNSFQL